MIVLPLAVLVGEARAQAPGTPVIPGRCDFYAFDGSIRRHWYCVEGTVGTGDGSQPPAETPALLYSYCEFPTYDRRFAYNSGLRFFSLTGPPHIEGSGYSVFFEFDSLGRPLYPEKHCSVTAIDTQASRSYYLQPPRDGTGHLLPGPWFFGDVSCGPDRGLELEESCSGTYDVRLFAKYGSARGRVLFINNEPVSNGFVVATDILDADERYVVGTDAAGNYTFTKTDTAQLPVLPPDAAHPSTPIPDTNNWGLPVFGDGGAPGASVYVFTGGPVQCPENPQSRMAIVRSSQATTVNLLSSGANCDGCPLPKISEITDPVAQQFEAEAAAGRNPVDRDNLTPEMRQGLECFEQAVGAAGRIPVITSAYRPTPYQKHLVEIWALNEAIKRLSPQDLERCREFVAAVRQEMSRHGFKYPPARVHSKHEDGEAFDARPPGVDLAAIEAACSLRRRVEGDSVHFERIP